MIMMILYISYHFRDSSLFSPSQRLPFGKTYWLRIRTQGAKDWKVLVKPAVSLLNLSSSTTNPHLLSANSSVSS